MTDEVDLLVAIPTRNRAQLLEVQLDQLCSQDFDGQMSLCVYTHDNEDNTLEVLSSLVRDVPERFSGLSVKIEELGVPRDNRDDNYHRVHWIIPVMVRAFNWLLDQGMYHDYTFFLPSDHMLTSPDTIRLLLDGIRSGFDVLSPLDITHYDYYDATNIYDLPEGTTNGLRWDIERVESMEQRPTEVPCVCGPIMYSRDALSKGVRFRLIEETELFEFDYMRRLQSEGVRVGAHLGVVTDHLLGDT